MDHPIVATYAKDFKVAIVGGGLCGLTCAIGLTRAGVDVDIYEAAPKFGEVGAGVGLGPNAIRVLRDLGILNEVMARADQPEPLPRSCKVISGLEGHEHIYDYPTTPEDVGLGIHRVAFLEALAHLVHAQKNHFNKRCIGISPHPSDPSQIQLNFADGTEATADVVLGADGIRSSLRPYVVRADGELEGGNTDKSPRLVFTNTVAYRALVTNTKLKDAGVETDLSVQPVCFTGPGKHIITFPITRDTVNLVAFVCDHSIPMGKPLPNGQWVTPRSSSELLAAFAGMGPDVLRILQCMGGSSMWSIHAVDPPLETYCRGRVALLGDAAHGMLPHLGAGAGQALEDALMLSRLLGHPLANKANVEDILQAYDMIRRPRGNMVLTASMKAGEVHDGHGPSGNSVEGIGKDYIGIWNPVWYHDMEADITTAITYLKERNVFL